MPSPLEFIHANPQIFTRRGSVVPSYRTKNGRRFGPYYRLDYVEHGRQRSRYLGRSELLAQEARNLLTQLQRPRNDHREETRATRLRQANLRKAKRHWQQTLRAYGLYSRGWSARGLRARGFLRIDRLPPKEVAPPDPPKHGTRHHPHTTPNRKRGQQTNHPHTNPKRKRGQQTNHTHTNPNRKRGQQTNHPHTNPKRKRGQQTNHPHTNPKRKRGQQTNHPHTNPKRKRGQQTNHPHTNPKRKRGQKSCHFLHFSHQNRHERTPKNRPSQHWPQHDSLTGMTAARPSAKPVPSPRYWQNRPSIDQPALPRAPPKALSANRQTRARIFWVARP